MTEHSPHGMKTSRIEWISLSAATADAGYTDSRDVAASTDQDAVPLHALHVAGAQPGPRLLMLAGVHGDEYEGIDTILRLYEQLQPQQIAGSVTLLPAANPLAYRAGNRISPLDGVNLARAFPGRADGTPTERLAYMLHHRYIAQCDFLLDLHSGGSHYAVATFVGYDDNPASEHGRRSRAAAEAFGAEWLWGHASVAPGRTVSSAGQLGIPWLYTEAFGGRRVRPEDGELFYNGTLRLMRHLGMLSQAAAEEVRPAPSATPGLLQGDGDFDRSVTALAEGFYMPDVPLMAKVQQGDRLGTIRALSGEIIQEVLAHKKGRLVMVVGTPVVKAGDPIYMLADTAD
ncbi:succinylglutamate desuccinylase/aspartoacylase family protein [Paenibacillus sp. J5C_2022]|uniref:succinylglutamate desuccinylase/aspartoacylase family protein n=1 Tax=Paenibacillus sp. J5C2022 TaxID=2977129 RepID=UPI0021D2F0B2|nr:succinylglutamate desuccinylase/aspartoacylase family protein [Paenibacillus sp. J5C2022]MCU6712629.1 succinylglutamate desuccinylase/aspartoacylase family protein [Paenibacillus sp. J5C2022]